MLRNTVSIDSSGKNNDGYSVRIEMNEKLGAVLGDPLYILIRLETQAENRLKCTRRCITNDAEYIRDYVNNHI